jgi:hypothetical protein
MHLRDVMVLPNWPGELKANIGRLRATSDHVTDILRHFLPRKYDLLGFRRIVILLGNFNPQTEALLVNDGVAEYVVPYFDSQAYLALSPNAQEERLLEVIELALQDIAARAKANPEPLLEAICRVRGAGFRLDVELPQSKAHKSRKFRVRIVRRHAPGGVTIRAEVVSKTGQQLATTDLLPNAWIVTAQDFCRGSRWEGDTLLIVGSSGNPTAEVPCGAYVES